jgi:hypothetical protein
MRFVKSALMGTGALALAAMLLNLAAPKALHALVATLVQDIDNPARHVWAGQCVITTSLDSGSCSIAVPSNEEVIVQNVSYSGSPTPPFTTPIAITLQYVSAGRLLFWQPPPMTPFNGIGGPEVDDARATTLYADPGSTITCGSAARSTGSGYSLSMTCNLNGYFVTNP